MKLLAWAKGKGDGRGEASMVVRYTYEGPMSGADAARTMDAGEVPAGATPDYPHVGYTIAVGHGVTVDYGNKRLRTFRH